MRARWGSAGGALVVGMAVVASGCGTSPSAVDRSPGAIVLDAAVSAQQQRTALVHMTLSSSGLPNGATVGGTGSGEINFETSAMRATFLYSGTREQGLKLTELFVGGHFYMALSQDGQGVSTVLPGKNWIVIPGNLASQATSAASENPADMLSGLRAKGNKVVDIGPSTVGGVPTEEYAVTINPAVALARLGQEHLPASMVQGAKAFLSGGPPTIKVWVTTSSDSLSQLAITMPFPAASTAPGASVTVTMGFSDYGAPVSIAAPPASTVASYSQFEQVVKQAQQDAQQ